MSVRGAADARGGGAPLQVRAAGGEVRLDAASAAREITAAGEAYLAGDYGAAVAHYELALQAGAEGADLWFNLGNALYRAGEQGRAVLAFERALRRDPGDAEARENLRLVRSQIEAPEVDAPLFARLGSRVDPDVAAALLVVCWSVACTALVLRRLRAARLVAAVALVVALCGVAVAGTAGFAAWQLRNDGWSIVVEEGEVLRAPEPSAPRLFSAHEGLDLRADRRIGAYVHVRAGDRSGWIEAARVEPIDR